MATQLSKTQIDQLGDRLREGALVEADLRSLDEYRRSFGEAHEVVVRAIREQLGLEPTGRPAKSTSSIVEKLRRERMRLSQMQDIAECRVVVSDLIEQDHCSASVRGIFPTRPGSDRRANPSYGYRAMHLIVEISGKLVEVQVRTSLQHLWAELSERMADWMDPAIKYGGGPSDVRVLLDGASKSVALVEELDRRIAALQEAHPDHEELGRMRGALPNLKREVADDLNKMIAIAMGGPKP